MAAQRTPIKAAPADTMLAIDPEGMGPPDGYEEVVSLPDFEHAVDDLRDQLRDRDSILRAISRLAGGLPGQSAIVSVLYLVEQAEFHEQQDKEQAARVDRLIEAAREYIHATEGSAEGTEGALQQAIRELDVVRP